MRGVSAAPVLIVCCANPQAYLDRYAEPDKGWTDRDPARWPVPYWDVDTGMAALLVLLSAVDQGLGALFFGVPAERPTTRSGAPSASRPHGSWSGSWPSATRPSGSRAPACAAAGGPLEDVVHWGTFGESESGRPERVGEDGVFDLHPVPGEPSRMARRRTATPTAEDPADFAEKIVDIDVEEEMQGAFLEYAYSRHLLPRAARRPRRPQAGAAPDPVRDGRAGPAARPRPREEPAASSAR